ncbi:7731_t:CDS:2, partial [Gigaspora rosea]
EKARLLRSHQIDKQIEEDSRKFKKEKEYKILLLGSDESGKSTIVKQMKRIHQNGYSKEELLSYRIV